MGANCRIGRTHADIASIGCCARIKFHYQVHHPRFGLVKPSFEFPDVRRLHGEQIDVAHLQVVEAETVCYCSGEIHHVQF
ncbi:MAG: hypothetical protein DMG76_25430 [Acidobacteria bacterium]|nr:MAG: hypothetical protein DMG76_25430 [Acidobacteriota bacterium]